MKTLMLSVALLSVVSFSANAGMRCGNELILEGDTVIKMTKVCGQPDQYGQNIIYLNKDSDGMNYFIHSDAAGIIDDIQSSRGGLR